MIGFLLGLFTALLWLSGLMGLLIAQWGHWKARALAAELEVAQLRTAERKRREMSRARTQPPIARRLTTDETIPSAVRRLATPLEPWTPPLDDED